MTDTNTIDKAGPTSPQATTLREIPLAASVSKRGVRVVAIDEEGVCHVFTRTGDENVLTAEQSFNTEGALATAERVLAGDPRTGTAHATLRILAAAVVVLTSGAAGGRT